MKKVLLIKLESEYYSSIGMEEAFKDAFEEVHSIDWQRIRFQGRVEGLKFLWHRIQEELITFKPDLILCQFQRRCNRNKF